jgi:hypothetical protein
LQVENLFQCLLEIFSRFSYSSPAKIFAFLNKVLAGIGTGDSSIEIFGLSTIFAHHKNFSKVLI